MLVLIN